MIRFARTVCILKNFFNLTIKEIFKMPKGPFRPENLSRYATKKAENPDFKMWKFVFSAGSGKGGPTLKALTCNG